MSVLLMEKTFIAFFSNLKGNANFKNLNQLSTYELSTHNMCHSMCLFVDSWKTLSGKRYFKSSIITCVSVVNSLWKDYFNVDLAGPSQSAYHSACRKAETLGAISQLANASKENIQHNPAHTLSQQEIRTIMESNPDFDEATAHGLLNKLVISILS